VQNYFVEMKLADSARPKSPQDGVTFIEGFVLPSLEILDQLQKEGRLLAGGPVAGAIELALIVRAESVQELDELVESLPVWVLMGNSGRATSNTFRPSNSSSTQA
jgi:hypothetical protein